MSISSSYKGQNGESVRKEFVLNEISNTSGGFSLVGFRPSVMPVELVNMAMGIE